jgi:ATP-dependent Lon protease
MPGQGGLLLTGQLGDVMQESARAALSWVRSNTRKLGLEENFFKGLDVHLHVPAGATPKDGPSAGVAMATVLTSLFTGRVPRSDVAMTGEITLRGVKEKVLAAKRAGIKTVILPAGNEPDVLEMEEPLRQGLNFIYAKSVEEAIAHALKPAKNSSA